MNLTGLSEKERFPRKGKKYGTCGGSPSPLYLRLRKQVRLVIAYVRRKGRKIKKAIDQFSPREYRFSKPSMTNFNISKASA
jgi:hypothetical protein